ncbi:MAG: 50S ribosomal protein L22 [Actinomycetota bacterium]
MAESRRVAGQATAGARYIHISSTKLNQVAALIRGAHVDEARRILAFTPKGASRELSKVLESAIANAENNFQLPSDELYVQEVRTDEGPTMKRFRPRAQGRAYRIRKRTSHLHITVERRSPQPRPQTGDRAGRPRRILRRGAEGATAGAGVATQAGSRRAGKGDRRGS